MKDANTHEGKCLFERALGCSVCIQKCLFHCRRSKKVNSPEEMEFWKQQGKNWELFGDLVFSFFIHFWKKKFVLDWAKPSFLWDLHLPAPMHNHTTKPSSVNFSDFHFFFQSSFPPQVPALQLQAMERIPWDWEWWVGPAWTLWKCFPCACVRALSSHRWAAAQSSRAALRELLSW